jgi:steroid delta-isomerase-like uncharacterized protein
MQDTPDTLIRQWFEELWNQGREETIDRILAPGARIFGLPTPDNKPISGPEEFKPFFRNFRAAFPDLRVTVERTITEGDLVAAHCLVRGTHRGDALGTPATNRAVEFSGMCIVRAAGGQLVEGWNCFDFLTCYQQIGLLPQLGS